MSERTLLSMLESLQNALEKMGTFNAHQSTLLDLMEREIETSEQEALLFSLHSCNSVAFDWRVVADQEIAAIKSALEASNVQ